MLVPYDTRVKSEIESFGGVVEKFIGEAVMAVFGAPVSHGDDAERALPAGLRVLDAIQELNKENPALDLTVRAAVNTGEAIVDARQQPDT
jgi:adenylate cyclase